MTIVVTQAVLPIRLTVEGRSPILLTAPASPTIVISPVGLQGPPGGSFTTIDLGTFN